MLRSLTCLAVVCLGISSASAEDWPQWRGPRGTGVSGERGLPYIWNNHRNLRWSTPLQGSGTSTPAIFDDAVFVTSHVEDGRLLLIKLHKQSGKIEWTTQVGKANPPRRAGKSQRGVQTFHRWHNLASPSPVTDGANVVVHFGNGLLACVDYDGKIRWSRDLQADYGNYTIWWGHANSPVLADGVIYSVVMQDSLADLQEKPVESFVIAHDVRDGHAKWRTLRATKAKAEQFDAYTTPLLTDLHGRTQLVVMGGNQLDSYDPSSGEQLWLLPNLIGGRTVTSPTTDGDTIYCTRGMRGPMLAVKVPADTEPGEELPRRAIDWTYEAGTPDSCSPVLWNDLLFFVSDDGIARCLDARFGTLKWKHRLPGTYKASPVVADGRLYFLNTDGLCTVASAVGRFDKLTENQLNDTTLASLAISDGRIFIRGNDKLYCVGTGQ